VNAGYDPVISRDLGRLLNRPGERTMGHANCCNDFFNVPDRPSRDGSRVLVCRSLAMSNARLSLNGREVTFPVVVGTECEHGIDISALRSQTGAITLDLGYGNTGACTSAITYIDGEKGILRYRGYSIEQLAEHAQFSEVAYLLIYGDLPNRQQFAEFRDKLTYHSLIHEDMK
jgi:hypothetical protein